MDGKESVLPPQHQVFINFRGDELRNNFISHLRDALRRSGINFFIDDQERKGEDIDNLFKRIEDSRIALAVFSSRYTESKWCLNELAKIQERVEQKELRVLPIFYKVSTSNVKQLKGEFGDNFRDQEERYGSNSAIIERWKAAIKFVSGKFGVAFEENRSSSESDFIRTIVDEVLKMLHEIPLDQSPNSSKTIKIINKAQQGNLISQTQGNASGIQFSQAAAPGNALRLGLPCTSCASHLSRECTGDTIMDEIFNRLFRENQVFINFRGDQQCNNFIGNLVEALVRNKINVFIDQDMIGEVITNLFKRIENSSIAIAVFSSRYTESIWCLDELLKIKEHVEEGNLLVLPIFYNVTPNNVKHLEGEFGDNFRDREYQFGSDKAKIDKWKDAVTYFARMSGLVFDATSSSESDFIGKIVKEVSRVLYDISSEKEERLGAFLDVYRSTFFWSFFPRRKKTKIGSLNSDI